MRRRALLTATASALSLGVVGCVGTPGPPDRPPVSCDNVSRPTPPEQSDGAVQPREYPGPPPDSLDDESATEYVERFETSYRQNHEIEARDQLHEFSGGTVESWTFEAPPDGAVVRLETVYGGTVQSENGEQVHYDSASVFVTYYVDPKRVVRAEATSVTNVDIDSLDPDPWKSGQPVACFQ